MTKGIELLLFLSFVTGSVALYCLSCTDSVSPRHCHYVRNCGNNEVCFTESHLSGNGEVKFNTGCRTEQTCENKRRDVISQKGLHRILSHSHCIECCSTDLCNNQGCGKSGYPLPRGPVCFDCQQTSNPMLCDTISVCDQSHVCHLQREVEFGDVYYSSRCINKHECASNVDVFGKRSTDHCSHCCQTDLCNGECTRGKEFLVLFMRNLRQTEGEETAYVFTEGSSSLNITSSPHLSPNMKATIDRFHAFASYINISFPNKLTCDYLTKESKALLLTTSELSTVVIFDSYDRYTTDGTLVIPTRKLSTEYIVSTVEDNSQFAVGSLHSDTEVLMRFNIKNNGTLALFGKVVLSGGTFSTRLGKFDTLQINHPTDLSGTVITANKPVAVFSGNQCKLYPNTGCSHMVSQLPPVQEYDKEYIIPPFFQNTGTTFQVVSPAKASINVTTGTDKLTFNLQAFEYRNFEVSSSLTSFIESDHPVQVVGFAMGSHSIGPYMTVFPGIHHYMSYYKISVPENYKDSFLCVIVPFQYVDNLRINDLPVNNYASVFQTISSSSKYPYSIHILKVQHGVYVLRTTDYVAFGLLVYGHRNSDGYGYAGNFVLP